MNALHRCLPLCALALSVTLHATPNHSTIESYVAPPGQFPAESNYAGRIPAPLAAYDGPQGTLVGHIRLEDPACVLTPPPANEAERCTFPPSFVYKPMGKPTFSQVELAEWGYETMGMPSYAPSVKDGPYAWSKIQHKSGTVWVKTLWEHVHPYESVAYLVEDLPQFCTGPGTGCRAISAQDTAEMKRLASLITCYNSAYSIVDRITYKGTRYYKLDIDTSGEHKTTLPHPIYVPTRRSDGSHFGDFYARGC